MENPNDFSQQVIDAVQAKTEWYNSTIMPQILDDYRLLHTCVKNLYDLMIKKSIIKSDPYKLDRKISGVTPLDNSQYIETERSTIIGMRFSEYETMLDWICTYYKFSIELVKIPEIKKLLDYNNSFLWNSLTPNNAMPNTRGLGQLVMEMKHSADPLTSSSINDILSKCQKASNNLVKMFKDLTEFQKEVYKSRIRKDIFQHPKFEKEKADASAAGEMQQIKKLFTTVFGKEPFYTQLVQEVIDEDHAANKAELQAALIKKLGIKQETVQKKNQGPDLREMLMAAVQTLCAFTIPLQTVYTKLNENNDILQSESNTFWGKLMAALKKAFNIPEKPVEYEVLILEQATNTYRKQRLEFTEFTADLLKKANFYNSFSVKGSVGYKKFFTADSTKVLEFLSKQITDIQKISVLLKALDDFFKNNAQPENRPKIKGLSMEIMAIKNNLVNTNQRRGEYISYFEEQEQMKKLGITN